MRKIAIGLMLVTGLFVFGMAAGPISAQEADEAAVAEVAPGVEAEEEVVQEETPGFLQVVRAGGPVGVILWLAIFAASVAGIALIVDSFITIRVSKIAPTGLVDKVRESMEQGDVMKALKHCEEDPGPLSNILSAGFSNVEEGFEAIQDSVGVAADVESEQLLQRVNYLNVVGNLSPMLGLLGTVQGMIFAFATLGTQVGAAQQAVLALNISQALYTTAAGLAVAVPAMAFFYYFRNRATKIILGMEGQTMDLIKVFRNVEVVNE